MNWLRVFGHAEASRMGQGVGQQRHTRVVRSEKSMGRRGRVWDGKARDVLPGMNAGASPYAVPSPIEGSGTAWVLLGSWALSPARPTPIPPRHECRGFSALLVKLSRLYPILSM